MDEETIIAESESPAIEITVEAPADETVAEEVAEAVEEMEEDTWQRELLAVVSSAVSLMVEIRAELLSNRQGQETMILQLLQVNTQLTAQISENQTATLAALAQLTPLPSPIVETPELASVSEAVPEEVPTEIEPQEIPHSEPPRRKRRIL